MERKQKSAKYRPVTEKQGHMIVDRLTQLNTAIMKRLQESGIQTAMIMVVAVHAPVEEVCRKPVAASCVRLGDAAEMMTVVDIIDRIRPNVKELETLADILHKRDHMVDDMNRLKESGGELGRILAKAINVADIEEDRMADMTDEELIPMLSYEISQQELVEIIAATEIKQEER